MVMELVRAAVGYREEFGNKLGVQCSSSPLLSINLLEIISRGFWTGGLYELLHAEDLMVIALSMGELLLKVGVIEVKVEKNLLHMNM